MHEGDCFFFLLLYSAIVRIKLWLYNDLFLLTCSVADANVGAELRVWVAQSDLQVSLNPPWRPSESMSLAFSVCCRVAGTFLCAPSHRCCRQPTWKMTNGAAGCPSSCRAIVISAGKAMFFPKRHLWDASLKCRPLSHLLRSGEISPHANPTT